LSNFILVGDGGGLEELVQGDANDEDIISNFFSASCAVLEVEGRGLCSAGGNSSLCLPDNTYSAYSEAFHCLVYS